MGDVRLEDINLNLLMALDALLAEGSVTRAAARARVTQSAMSHALANLRALLGDELLVRGRRGLVLTPKAEQLTGPLRRGLQELQRAIRGESSFDPRTSRRTFSIATKDNLAVLFVPRLLALLEREAPNVNLRMRPCEPRVQAELLESGAIDLAVQAGHEDAPGLLRRRLLTERFVCLVREGHPAVKGRLDLATYVRLSHVLISFEGDGPGTVDVELAKVGLERRIAVRLPWVLACPMIVASSDLVLTAPRCVAEVFSEAFAVRTLEPPIALPTFDVVAMWHERFDQDAAHRWLRDVIVRTFMSLTGETPVRRRKKTAA